MGEWKMGDGMEKEEAPGYRLDPERPARFSPGPFAPRNRARHSIVIHWNPQPVRPLPILYSIFYLLYSSSSSSWRLGDLAFKQFSVRHSERKAEKRSDMRTHLSGRANAKRRSVRLGERKCSHGWTQMRFCGGLDMSKPLKSGAKKLPGVGRGFFLGSFWGGGLLEKRPFSRFSQGPARGGSGVDYCRVEFHFATWFGYTILKSVLF